MKSVRRLLVAFYSALSVWLASLAIADGRDRRCNLDDLTECDVLGEILLVVSVLLPAVLIGLLLLLLVATGALLREMEAREWIRQPPVIAVIGTLGLLAIVLAVAVFGNLEALISTRLKA
jgi:ABC-type microcin C transport system permease subunit YejB